MAPVSAGATLLAYVVHPTLSRHFPDNPQIQGNRTAVEGTEFSPQPTDSLILKTCPRLKGHLPRFSAIHTNPSCRFHLAIDFPGLRRSGSWSQIINQAQDFPKQIPRHGNLRQLERDVAAMSDNLGTDLHQLLS